MPTSGNARFCPHPNSGALYFIRIFRCSMHFSSLSVSFSVRTHSIWVYIYKHMAHLGNCGLSLLHCSSVHKIANVQSLKYLKKFGYYFSFVVFCLFVFVWLVQFGVGFFFCLFGFVHVCVFQSSEKNFSSQCVTEFLISTHQKSWQKVLSVTLVI